MSIEAGLQDHRSRRPALSQTSETAIHQLLFKSHLELGDVLFRRTVALLSRHHPETPKLIQVPFRCLSVAEGHFTTDQSPRAGKLIYGY